MPTPLSDPAPRTDARTRAAWQTQVAAARHTPGLLPFLMRQRHDVLPRFATVYHQLRTLPKWLRRRLQRHWHASLGGLALLLTLGQAPALAVTINVDGTICTLVDAIKAANTNALVGGCDGSASTGADTLVLEPSSVHTLTAVNNLTYGATGLPVVSSEITIEGHGSTIQRDSGAPAFRILAVNATGNLTLQETTISGGIAIGAGNDGGGIFNNAGAVTLLNSILSGNIAGNYSNGGGIFNAAGTMTLSASTVSGNTAVRNGGGIFNAAGTVTLSYSTVSDNGAYGPGSRGGGIFNAAGTVTLSHSTVSDNGANAGGGIYNVADSAGARAVVTVSNSTLSGNVTVHVGGGGVYNCAASGARAAVRITHSTLSGNRAVFGRGGGVSNQAFDAGTRAAVRITNSTLSGNDAFGPLDGGGVSNSAASGARAAVRITHSTLSGNAAGASGGGVSNEASAELTLARSLLSGNTAPIGAEVRNASGTIAADTYNLLGHSGLTNAQAFSGFTPGATDFTATSDGTTPTALTSILAPTLANNGGSTQTHSLVLGSPALDASPADADCLPTDQRGVLRPQGPACDIGAFELVVEDCGNNIDDDGDGLIDLLDPDCPSAPLTITKGNFTLGKDPGEDKISLEATFAGTALSLNPRTEGVTLTFLDGDGVITHLTVPAGRGWQASNGPKWKFEDQPTGVKITIKFDAETGTFALTAKLKDVPLNDPDAGNIATSVVIGEAAFLNTQPWKVNKKGNLVTP